MQLILNPETEIDIQRKMSVIEQESFEETFKVKDVSQDLNSVLSNINEDVSFEEKVIEECIEDTKTETHNITKDSEYISKKNDEREDDKDLNQENSNNEIKDKCQNGIASSKDSESIENMEVERLENILNGEEKCEDVEMIELQLNESENNCKQSIEDNDEEKKGQEEIVDNEENDVNKNKDNNLKENVLVIQSVSTETDSDKLKLSLGNSKMNSEDIKPVSPDSLTDNLKTDSEQKPDSDQLQSNSEDLTDAHNIKSDCKDLTLGSDIVQSESEDQNPNPVDMKLDTDVLNSNLSDLNKDNDILKLDSSGNNESKRNNVKNADIINICDEKEDECKLLELKTKNVEKSDKLLEPECKTTAESTDNKTSEENCDKSNNIEESKQSINVISVGEEVITSGDQETDNTKIVKDNINREDVKENIPSSNSSTNSKALSHICKLSNTLDILSDEEDEGASSDNKTESQVETLSSDKQCIQIEDDDDILLIDDDSTTKSESNKVPSTVETATNAKECNEEKPLREEFNDEQAEEKDILEENNDDSTSKEIESDKQNIESTLPCPKEPVKPQDPLLPLTFLKTCKKNLADMTRNELEEFCILKIVDSVVNRSNLNDIKSQLKIMAQSIEEYKKKAMLLTKQNRDLQVVLKSVQEEQKKRSDLPITPLKITRSVGMQVFMTDKSLARKKSTLGSNNLPNSGSGNSPANKLNKSQLSQTPKSQKPQATTNNAQQIPVPRLVPASNTINNSKSANALASNKSPSTPATPNGVKNSPPVQKPVKRPNSKIGGGGVTVDLTDDEPPAKVIQLNINPPVRLVPPQNLMAPQRQPFNAAINTPRKVYIPISGSQNQVRPGQTIMLKPIVPQGPRQPRPHILQKQNSAVRMTKIVSKHPAPLPDCMKQYQPLNWKLLPPAPELKLSKVENGIVISWKIDGYQDENHEEIASYQLYAYQETSSPPSTALWKKIGDVKALPLPMACTLTQFMAGYKYYFAVRAVDIRSRLGPFSTPGSILLLNKM